MIGVLKTMNGRVELKDFIFRTLYHCTATLDLNISNVPIFLDLFFFLLAKCLFCIHSMYLVCAF